MTAQRRVALVRLRRTAWLLAAVLLGAQLAVQGVSPWTFAAIAAIVLIGLAAQAIETRTVRPAKTYLRAALAVAVLALIFVAMPLLLSANLWIGLILWVGLSVAGLAWAAHYERTEPR